MSEVINSNDIRINNSKRVIFALRNSAPVTKKDLSDSLNLSLPTIASITKTLEDKGYIIGCGSADAVVGRKPNLVSLARDACYAVGISIDTHSVEVAVVNFGGDVLAQRALHIFYSGDETYWTSISSEVNNIIADLSLDTSKIQRIGIALPYIFNSQNWDIFTLSSYPENAVSVDLIPGFFSYPVYLISPAVAAGVPGYWNRNFARNCVVIYLSRYIEGCIMIKDPVSGAVSAQSCQLGHLSLDFKGKDCFCGKKGCFQQYCSTSVIIDQINDIDTSRDIVGISPKKHLVNWVNFFNEIENGNAEYLEIWDNYLETLAYAIHNISLIVNYDIVISGEISEYIFRYKNTLVEKIRKISPYSSDVDFNEKLITASFAKNSACVGAALFIFDSMIDKN